MWRAFKTLRTTALGDVNLENMKQKQTNSVALFRERTIPTERPPLVGEVSANFCRYRVLLGQYNGSLRPYSRFSIPEILIIYLYIKYVCTDVLRSLHMYIAVWGRKDSHNRSFRLSQTTKLPGESLRQRVRNNFAWTSEFKVQQQFTKLSGTATAPPDKVSSVPALHGEQVLLLGSERELMRDSQKQQSTHTGSCVVMNAT
jgi:hypothetical protein